MKIEKGILISVEASDIKKGVLSLPKKVKEIADEVIVGFEELTKVIAPGLTTIGSYNFRYCNALTSFESPVLTTIGSYNFYECNALTSFESPVLTTIGSYNFRYCNALTSFESPVLTTIGSYNFYECNALTSFESPVLTTIGSYNFYDCNALTSFESPVLTTIGSDNFRYCNALTSFESPVLTTIGSYNFRYCNALTSFESPVLTTIGSYNFRYCNALTSFESPVLTTIGSYNFYDCNALTSFESPVLTTIGSDNFRYCNALNNVKFGKHVFTVKSADGLLTVIEKSKTSKGIHIHTGFIFIRMEEGEVEKKETFLTEKEGFFAHGETVKKSIGDLNFKIVAERLKNDPIYEDTVITDMYYRTVTGACEQGVKSWREQNNITVEKITAKELLPILEKSNAYGVEKFKKLVNF